MLTQFGVTKMSFLYNESNNSKKWIFTSLLQFSISHLQTARICSLFNIVSDFTRGCISSCVCPYFSLTLSLTFCLCCYFFSSDHSDSTINVTPKRYFPPIKPTFHYVPLQMHLLSSSKQSCVSAGIRVLCVCMSRHACIE